MSDPTITGPAYLYNDRYLQTQVVSGTVTQSAGDLTDGAGRLQVDVVSGNSLPIAINGTMAPMVVHLDQPLSCTVRVLQEAPTAETGWRFDAPSAGGGAVALALFFVLILWVVRGARA